MTLMLRTTAANIVARAPTLLIPLPSLVPLGEIHKGGGSFVLRSRIKLERNLRRPRLHPPAMATITLFAQPSMPVVQQLELLMILIGAGGVWGVTFSDSAEVDKRSGGPGR
jgi:hypothetical protein